MKFEFTVNGEKSLRKLEKDLIERILKKLAFWENTNNPLKYAEKIEGYIKLFKYRIGSYRIIVLPNLKKGTIDILKVGHRKSVYQSLNSILY